MTTYTPKTHSEKVIHANWYLNELKNKIDSLDKEAIARAIEAIENALLDGKRIFIAGNGGSSATANHIASDLQKTTLGKNPHTKNHEIRFRATSLSDNIPVMTAWANDEGYEYIFSEQLKVLADAGDLLIVITGSGNSPNIVRVVEVAKEMGVKTFAFLGFTGGKVKGIADDCIVVESDNFGFIEDIHMVFDHLITDYLKKNIS